MIFNNGFLFLKSVNTLDYNMIFTGKDSPIIIVLYNKKLLKEDITPLDEKIK